MEMEEASKFRQLTGPLRIISKVLLCAIPVVGISFILELQLHLGVLISKIQYVGLFLGLVLAAAFLLVPSNKSAPRDKVPWYDLGLSAVGLILGLYFAISYFPQIFPRLSYLSLDIVILGFIAIGVVLEACRRLVGWVLVVLALFFIFYARYAYLVPGVLSGREISWQRLASYLYLDVGGLCGIALQITALIVLGFILFSRVFFTLGGGKFLTDLSLALVGRYRGGVAKSAVLVSSLFGTVSGSTVANVSATGSFTIPLMKRFGYKPYVAAAVEAASSNGGQIMPPVMGVTAFVIAEFLGIPYKDVAIAATVPALLYYLMIFLQIDMEAAKENLRGLPPQELPSLLPILKKGLWFLIPVIILIYTLFVMNLSPEKSATYAAISALVLGSKQIFVRPRKLLTILEETGGALLSISVICGVAGFVIAGILLTALDTALPLELIRISGGNVLILLMLTALLSIIMGMGLPTTPLYILLALMLAPSLTLLGLEPLSAHLFIFYFGLISMLTPPICIAAYVAAAIAGASPMRTGFEGVRLAIMAYIMPFVFIFSPGLLLRGPIGEMALVIPVTAIGGVMLITGIRGYLFKRLNPLKRILLILAGAWLLLQAAGWMILGWVGIIIAIGIAILVPTLEWYKQRKSSQT